jgi:PEP-CTERM motif
MKQAFALVVLMVTPSIMFAQGTISVANNATKLVQAWASNWDHSLSPVPVGGGMVQFCAAPDGTAYKPLGTLVLAERGFALTYNTLASYLAANPGWNAYSTAPIAPVAGRFNAGTVTVAPLAAGGNIEYVMIGWTGPSTTLDAAIASGSAFIGESALYTGIATRDPTSWPVGLSSWLGDSFLGLTLAPIAAIPEPSTFALAGLGAVMLIVSRQRS